jgi:hypothetical protein
MGKYGLGCARRFGQELNCQCGRKPVFSLLGERCVVAREVSDFDNKQALIFNVQLHVFRVNKMSPKFLKKIYIPRKQRRV